MYARLFSLVSPTHNFDVYAWGIEIAHRDGVEAVTYRRDPETNERQHGVHNSAEAAKQLYDRMLHRILPSGLLLVWMDGDNDDFAELFEPEPDPDHEPVLALK